jgi:hypothetical protein
MAATAFPADPELTAIAIAYRNPDVSLIADSVLPRASVGSTLFSYTQFNDVHKAFTLPQMRTGPRSRVNRVDLSGVRTQGETYDNAIEIPLSYYDTNGTGKGGSDPRKSATEFATSLVLLQHEIDVANLVFDLNTYPLACRETVLPADQFTEAAADPMGNIDDGLDAALVRPNVLVFGQRAWSAYRRHISVVQSVHGSAATHGRVTREQVAELHEVQEVVVGTGWVNTAKPGAAANMVRVWGGHVAAVYRDRAAAQVGGLTFGATFEFGTRLAGMIPDPEMGLRGGELAKVGESTKPLICAPYAGYFWQNAVAA